MPDTRGPKTETVLAQHTDTVMVEEATSTWPVGLDTAEKELRMDLCLTCPESYPKELPVSLRVCGGCGCFINPRRGTPASCVQGRW